MNDESAVASNERACSSTRSIEETVAGLGHGQAADGLERRLGGLQLTLMGVGVIVGAGVFVITGTAAAQFAGPAIIISFFLAALACGLCALCYAELSTIMPASGSAYTYTQVSLGEVVAWFVGWNLVMEYVFAASYVSVGWSGYVTSLLASIGIAIPSSLTAAPVAFENGGLALTGSLINLPAVCIIFVMTLVARRGIGFSTTVNALIVALKIGVLITFVLAGLFYVDPANWSPFLPANTGVYGHFGWSGVLTGAAVVFVAYLGFDAVATAAQETVNPQRNMPIGILGSLGVCAFFFAAVSFVLTGLESYTQLDVANPLSNALHGVGGSLDWLAPLVDAAAVIGLPSVILVILLAQPRVLMAMGRDGLLPSPFRKVHATYRTPSFGTAVTGATVAFIGGFLPVSILAQLVSLGTLSVFIVVCISVVVLRRKRPDLKRAFRVPFSPVIPVLGALFCVYLLFGLPPSSWILYGGWSIIGAMIYLYYGRPSAQKRRRFVSEPPL